MTPTGIWQAHELASPEQVEQAKPILRDALASGKTRVWVGLVEWHFTELVDPPSRSMPCGHPYAARKITSEMTTTCWACQVEREIE